MSEEDRIDDYRKLAGSITNYTDNTCFYEDWLVIQQYVEDWLDELDKYKQVIDKIKEELKEADEAVEYWQKECDKRSEVLDKIKKIMEADLSNMGKLVAINIMLKKDKLLEEIE